VESDGELVVSFVVNLALFWGTFFLFSSFHSFYSLCSFSVIAKGKEYANPLIFHHTLYTHLFFFFFFFFWGRETFLAQNLHFK